MKHFLIFLLSGTVVAIAIPLSVPPLEPMVEDLGSQVRPGNVNLTSTSPRAFWLYLLPLIGKVVELAGEILKETSPNNGEHVVSVTDFCGPNGQLKVQCDSADDRIGPRFLNDKDGMAYKFKQNFWGTTHFWCNIWWNGKWQTFPAFGGGAPKNRLNDFRVYGYGIYLGNQKFRDWA